MINLAQKTLKIRENITSVHMFSCEISPVVYKCVVRKLQDCDKLQRLYLGGFQPLNIDKAITTSTSLCELYLYKCKIQPEVYQDIIWQLSDFTVLEKLHFNYKQGIPMGLGDVVSRMGNLNEFYVKLCYIEQDVTESVLAGLANCKNLQDLCLVGNELTDCLGKLFPETNMSEPSFPHLNRLWLNKTKLSQDDLQVLSRSLCCNKLPQLMYLDMSLNKLTGSLQSLLCATYHSGFLNL